MEFFNKLGTPIDQEKWAARQAAPEYWMLRWQKLLTADRGLVEVQTIWEGVDVTYKGEGIPLIFSTMITCEGDERNGFDLHRYATQEAAVAGHEAIVATLTPAVSLNVVEAPSVIAMAETS